MGQMQTQVCVVSLTPAARRHVKEQQDGEDIPSGGLGMGHGSWQVELGRQLRASAAVKQPTVAAQEEMAGSASTMREVKSSLRATIDIKIYRSSLPIVSHSVYCMVAVFSCLKGGSNWMCGYCYLR